MKRKITLLKRSLTMGLAAVMIAGAISGCGASKKDDENLINQATKNSKEYVFRMDQVDFLDATDFSNISIVGDKIYAASYAVDGGISVSSFKSDGSDLSTIKVPEADNESHGYITFDNAGNMYSILSVYNWGTDSGVIEIQPDTDESGSDADADTDTDAGSDSEGTSEPAETTDTSSDSEAVEEIEISGAASEEIEIGEEGMGDYSSSDEKQYLIKNDPQGNELFRIDLANKAGEDEYFSVYSMNYVEGTGLLISSNLGVEKYDDQGQLVSKVLDTNESGSAYYQAAITLYNGDGGKLYASYWGDNGLELRSFDPETGKMGEKSTQFQGFDDYSFFTGKGYDLYVSKSDGFYGYQASKDQLVKILDYADSDINVSYSVSTAVAVSDKEFFANLPDEDYNYALYRLTKIDPSEVKDKTLITLAGNYVDYTVRQKVFKFNQESDAYKIKIIDYSSMINSDDYEESANQFNLDIVSGNVPDIMFFSTDEPVDSYINKGLFLDLNTYLQNDPDLKDVEFVENVMDAFKTGDKLYQLAPSFYIESLATKADYLGGSDTLTLKDCEDMIEGKGVSYLNSFGMTDKQSMLYNGLIMAGSHFIDWESKSCNFGGDEFINFLEFCNKFPETITDEMWEKYEDTAYMKGDSLFSFAYVNGFRPYRRYVDATFAGDIRFCGFPNNMGINCSVIVPEMRFAISAQSKNADAAWQLLRQFLLEDYQNEITYEFPIRKSSFDKLAADSMERMYWIDDDGNKQYEDDIMYLGDEEVVVKPLTQEEVDYMKEFVGSLSMAYNANQNVYNIITEEASAFFSGQKSAKEVADIIQSRVSIYVNENS